MWMQFNVMPLTLSSLYTTVLMSYTFVRCDVDIDVAGIFDKGDVRAKQGHLPSTEYKKRLIGPSSALVATMVIAGY